VGELGKAEKASKREHLELLERKWLIPIFPSSYGGREAALQAQAQQGLRDGEAEGKRMLAQAEETGKGLVDEARRKASEVADKVIR